MENLITSQNQSVNNLRKAYSMQLAKERLVVFDIGMHTGQDTNYYLRSGYKVIAAEANPILAAENEKKFSEAIDSGQLVILNKGISNTKGTLPFYINHSVSEWSSFDKTLGTRRGRFELRDIPCITIQDMIAAFGLPYYIKVDIEGYDFYVVDGLTRESKPAYFSCELTADCSLIDKLYEKGYRHFKLINQADNFQPIDLDKEKKWWRPYYLHLRNGILLRVQNMLPIRYPYSSSGPFGEEAKGDWMDYETTRKLYHAFLTGGKGGNPINNRTWYDVHAKV